jgi:threonine dehydrogenase-like Zn-dependent dehydrogenase
VAKKRALALQLGADVAVDPSTRNIAHEVERLTDGAGADLVVECVGSAATIRSLPFLVRRGGMVAQLGAITGSATFDYGYIHFKHFIIVPSDYFRTLREVRSQVASALRHLADGTIQLKPLISHRYRLLDLPLVFARLRNGGHDFVKIAVDIE